MSPTVQSDYGRIALNCERMIARRGQTVTLRKVGRTRSVTAADVDPLEETPPVEPEIEEEAAYAVVLPLSGQAYAERFAAGTLQRSAGRLLHVAPTYQGRPLAFVPLEGDEVDFDPGVGTGVETWRIDGASPLAPAGVVALLSLVVMR